MTNKKHDKDELYEKRPYGRQSVLTELERAKKYRNKRVLVAGCGAGARVFDLYFYGANITAVDQSRSAIQFIRSQFNELDCEPSELIVDDLTDIELPAGEFDYVICYGVLHHTPNPEAILRNLRDALQTDGSLEIILYHRKSFARIERNIVESLHDWFRVGDILPNNIKRKIEWWDKYENPIWKTYTRKEARSLVESSGFTVDELWLSNSPFGQFTNWLLPPLIKYYLSTKLSDYRWHIHINAKPQT
ncbi:class I SAM-dependent methyltransferase [Haloarcula sp. GH36]|uniref:class I SAM-dependent methyltransferase n=1 Tax=Haloarcula montana TaxID=3111776 RepID=UPI002D78A259|nr:class I SAM-dependent methyltransferase [Haloarcula sp. GH36]